MSIFSSIQEFVSKLKVESKPPYSNILHNYATYNYIWTLSVLDQTRINSPSTTYKKGDLGQVIFKSGSGDPSNRIQIGNYGAFDFFIEDVTINSVIGFDQATGNTNATKISFKVIEPYSMGMFFHALQIAARQMEHETYVEAPFLLTLEFKGNLSPSEYGVTGDNLSSIEKTTKHFPIKLLLLDMNVTESGTEYTIDAIPWNEVAASSTYTQLKSDITLSGKTVQELLQSGPSSLEAIVNKRLLDEAVELGKDPDQILILFPKDPKTSDAEGKTTPDRSNTTGSTKDPSETTSGIKLKDVLKVKTQRSNLNVDILVQDKADVNIFGSSSMTFDQYTATSTPFAENDFVYDEKTGTFTRGKLSLKVNNNVGEMKFAQGGSVIDIINEVILMSEYGQKALQQEEIKTYKGNLMWWRIDFQSYLNSSEKNISKTGEPQKLIVFRIVPYQVSASKFLPPDKADPNIEDKINEAVKAYEYIYTAKNYDIISFDINFKMALYQAMFDPSKTGDEKAKPQQANISEPEKPKSQESWSLPERLFDVDKLTKNLDDNIRKIKTDSIGTNTSKKGGSLSDTALTKLTKQAHDIILNGIDMVSPTIKILGDPYYLGDSGLGNYTAQETELSNMNGDNGINYQNGEVDIMLTFKTPLDIDMSTGVYNFGGPDLVSKFSGLFQVVTCDSSFSKGEFTQELKLVRRLGQDPAPKRETDNKSATKSTG